MVSNLLEKTESKNLISISKYLMQIYGLGSKRIKNLCGFLGIAYDAKIKDLEAEQIETLTNHIKMQTFLTDQELKNFKVENFKRLLEIKSCRGLRRFKGYPVRGQRTHSNGKTPKKRRSL